MGDTTKPTKKGPEQPRKPEDLTAVAIPTSR
jgi:hypothetical protein